MNTDHIQEFVAECREGLDRIDDILIALESTPDDRTGLRDVFRTLHTMKGNAGFLGLPQLGAIAHAGESLLSKLMQSTLRLGGEVADVLLQLFDAIRNVISEVEATGKEGNHDLSVLRRDLDRWTAIADGASTDSEARVHAKPELADQTLPRQYEPVKYEPNALLKADDGPSTPKDAVELVGPAVAELELTKAESERKFDLARQVHADNAVYAKTPTIPSIEDPPQSLQSTSATSHLQGPGDGSSSSLSMSRLAELEPSLIRVRIDQLDDLVNLVGELVLARNRIVQIAASRLDDELTEPIQRLHRLTSALQDGVMRTRMQPVRNAWKKYPRIVRDLAKQCGKQCDVELQGGDTEFDKSILEAIADPMVHLVRNAIDHGIEKPYLRKIKGKPETGRLLVRAFQESGQVNIEISDDGAGMDLERIRKKVVEAGIVAAERVHQISESELQNSIFLPGFTTADQVTSLSGRGVGMDVVKTCVEQIGGTIELRTQKDVGTTIRLTLPLTLAIVPAIMVASGEHRFAIPQINVVELLRLQGDEKRIACEQFHDTPVLRLRGELLPLTDLCVKLDITPRVSTASREALDIVILKAGTRRYALLVDEIGDLQEIVVKPMGPLLENQIEYGGAAMMGDGTIALILDVLGLARSSGLLNADQTLLCDTMTIRESTASLDEQVLICLVDDRQIALPLADVVCLEHIASETVESSAIGEVMQYRGDILPLHDLRGNSPGILNPRPTAELLSVVIYRTSKSSLALLVDRIVDVAPRPIEMNPVHHSHEVDSKPSVIATAVVLGRVTDFLQLD